MSTQSSRRPLRWGIMGTGGIAATFATDLNLLPSAEIVAVGSRSQAGADRFAARFGIPGSHGSYAALAADPVVEAVYVATPHPAHRECALIGLRAGKAVLVEKPFALNFSQACEVVAEARARHLFLMEAMWTRFLPHVVRVRELIAEGEIGEVRSLQADFGEVFAPDPAHRSFAPTLGGGALLDLGVYPISFASMLFGAPTQVAALTHEAFTGVDSQTGIVLKHPGGEIAVLLTTLETQNANMAIINGTKGRIEIDGDFLAPSRFRLVRSDGGVDQVELPHVGRGLRHEAAEVGRCLEESLTESPIIPLGETLSIMATLDQIRRQIGLRYPGE